MSITNSPLQQNCSYTRQTKIRTYNARKVRVGDTAQGSFAKGFQAQKHFQCIPVDATPLQRKAQPTQTLRKVYNFRVHTLSQLFFLAILQQKFSKNLQVLSLLILNKETTLQVRVEYVYNTELDIEQNKDNENKFNSQLRQYFYLGVEVKENLVGLRKLELGKAIKKILFLRNEIALVKLGSTGDEILRNISSLINFFKQCDVNIHLLNREVLLFWTLSTGNEQMHHKYPSLCYGEREEKVCRWEPCGDEEIVRVDRYLCLDLGKLARFIQGQYPDQMHQYFKRNLEIISELVSQNCIRLNAFIHIDDYVGVKFFLEFNSTLPLRKFLMEAYANHLWTGISYDSQVPSNNISLEIGQLSQLEQYIQYFQAEYHGSQSKPLLEEKLKATLSNQNCQSSPHQLQDTSDDIFALKDTNETLQRYDFLTLKSNWESGLQNALEEICKNWEVFQFYVKREIEMFTMINLYKKYRIESSQKSESKPIYEQLFPNINYFLNFFLKKLGIQDLKTYISKQKKEKAIKKDSISNIREQAEIQEACLEKIRKQLRIEENIADKIFYYYLKDEQAVDLQIKNERNISMKDYITQCQDFYLNSSHWNNVFASFGHRSPSKQPSIYFKEIQNQRLVQHECLSCSKFFIKKQNIYDELASKCPLKIFPYISKLKDFQTSVKDEICGLLNGGGGVILFDCVKNYREIWPYGVPLNQKDKEQIQQRIYSYIYQFYPRLQVKTNVYITFVPVFDALNHDVSKMQNYSGTEGILKENYVFKKKQYISGHFVTRIKIVPADPSAVYFWFISNKTTDHELRKYCQIRTRNGGLKSISTREMGKLIKRRMKDFYIRQEDEEKKRLLTFPSTYITHECEQPELGITIADSHKPQPNQDQISIQEQYKYLTLLIAKIQFHNKIKSNFRRSRLNFQIKLLFTSYNFKPALNTAALYHNNKFDQIYRLIHNNPYYIFNNRPVLVINVTSYLKLDNKNQSNPVSESDWNRIEGLFTERYPQESLRLFEFKASQTNRQFYLLTETKTSNLFLYYVLNHRGEKSSFKNPYLLDKLSVKERQERMVLQYEKKGRNEHLTKVNSASSRQSNQQSQVVDIDLDQQVEGQLHPHQKDENNHTFHKAPPSNVSPCDLSIESDECQDYLYSSWQQVFSSYDYPVAKTSKSFKIRDL